MKRLLMVFVSASLMSQTLFAFTECTRPVKNIWSNLVSPATIHISFSDGGSNIYKEESQLTDGQMARLVSMAITAQTTGRKLTVRYPEDGLTCPPTGVSRGDIWGIWLMKE